MDAIPGFSAPNRSKNNPQGLSNCSWNLVCCWVKICPSTSENVHPSFQRFGYSAPTRWAMDKRRPQADSAHQIGLETSLVAFLIVGWWCFINGWKYWPEFFTLECFCLYLNNQWSHGQMDATCGFSASNWSKTNPQRLSNCSWNLVWKSVLLLVNWNFHPSFQRFACSARTNGSMDKWMPQLDSAHQIGPETTLQVILIVVERGGTGGRINAAGIFHSQNLGPLLLVPQQPAVPWTNGCYRRIQRIKLV